MIRFSGLIVTAIVMLATAPAAAQNGGTHERPLPVSDLRAADHAWDGGSAVDLTWQKSPDDHRIESYQVLRAVASIDGIAIEPHFAHVEYLKPGADRYTVRDLRHEMDIHDIRKEFGDQVDVEALRQTGRKHFDIGYLFRVVAISPHGAASEAVKTDQPIVPVRQWFDGKRLPLAFIVLIFCGAVVFWINHARRGRPVRVRKIAGLEAVDEAVGRATEMGRPCLFVPGIQDMNEIQTIAGITVLSRVAKTAAEYDARVEVPTSKSLVMTACRETVQAAYLSAGRPDAFNQDLIYYVTDEQFGYVAYLQGMMVRKKPAACFYMGSFFAESLILAETGNAIGAIQIAGTAQPAQLPFFVAACDYTLIGEEFFAASAYLSGSPEELGSLKGQDVGKSIVGLILVIGTLMATAANALGPDSGLGGWLSQAVTYLKSSILS